MSINSSPLSVLGNSGKLFQKQFKDSEKELWRETVCFLKSNGINNALDI